jgi:hypothetical protein
VFVCGGGVGDLYIRIQWYYLSPEALLIEIYASIAIEQFSLQILELVNAALTGVCNFDVRHLRCVITKLNSKHN